METSTVTSPKFSLNSNDLKHLLKIVLWSGCSAVIASVIAHLGDIAVPDKYVFLVPLVNTVLVSIQRYFSNPS